MTSSFSELYAECYDLLYADKDYVGEARYVGSKLREVAPATRRVLELGSGTGRHAALLAEAGFEMAGIERSAAMLECARALGGDKIAFVEGDIRAFDLNHTFDAVAALFHVVSYLSSNEDVLAGFRAARRHLERGGLFMFDVWYGPAVLTCRPESRVKAIETEDFELVRFAETTLDMSANLAHVRYRLHLRRRADGRFEKGHELHTMRYFFLPELKLLLAQTGFELLLAEEWMTGRPLDGSTWNGLVVAKAVDHSGPT